jgi:hypothetical protein
MKIRLIPMLVALLPLSAVAAYVLFVQSDSVERMSATNIGLANHALNQGDAKFVAPVLSPDSSARPRDWMHSYHESTDDYSLAQELAKAASIGDGRADYLLGEVLLRCEMYRRILLPYTEGTVAERVEFHLANSNLPNGPRKLFRQGALRCEQLFSEDPFEGYDLPEEAREFRYWTDRAVDAGDPLAVMNRTAREAVGRSPTDDPAEERAFRDSVLRNVRLAVFSDDSAALFAVGGLFSHPSIVADPHYGYAWLVAACDTGYDCSRANPNLGFGCVEDGTCNAGQTLLDTMQRDFGPTKYAEIYANAQDIQYKIDTNDWDGLQKYLEIK